MFSSILLGQTASIPDTVAFVGENVSIPVIITDVVELEGLEFTVQYDVTVLTATSTSFENTELDGMNFNVQLNLDTSGEIRVVAYAGTNQFFSGGGNLIFINFDVVGELLDSSDLTFTAIEINNNSILENAQNGSVTININGCTDMLACNFNVLAEIDNGSCWFSIVGCNCSDGEGAALDCADVCGGPSIPDQCGICDGGNADDIGCGCFEAGPSGCDNACGSTLELDDCGDCGGGNAAMDDCGVCEGDNSTCMGCTNSGANNFCTYCTLPCGWPVIHLLNDCCDYEN